MVCWDPRIEEMPKEDLQRMQYKLFKSLVYRLYSFSPFYHDRMKEQKVHPDDIKELSDVKKLPFMFKRDLRDGYPDKIFTCNRRRNWSGTMSHQALPGNRPWSGTPRTIWTLWTTSLARALTSRGLGRGDVIQVSYGYGLFTGGLGLHYGAERIGATVLPTSVGNTERQIELMQDLGSTAIACTPSYLLHMGEVAEKMGVNIKKDTKLRTGILGAEPWTEGMRNRMQDWLGIKAYDIYGTSELSGPMFTECAEQKGFHIWSDIALVEIIDPKTGEPLEPGEKGELTITILQKEALPMIRYRIGDITSMDDDVCPCGRTHPRIQRIHGQG